MPVSQVRRVEAIETRELPGKKFTVVWQDIDDPSKWYTRPVYKAKRERFEPLTEEEVKALDGVVIEVVYERDWRAYKPAKIFVV